MEDHKEPTNPDDFDAEIAKMLGHIEEWKEKEYARLKDEHDRKYGHQTDLFGEVDGIKLDDIRHHLIQLLIIEEVLETVNASRNTVYQVMKEKRLPVKTIKGSLKIAKARRKRDASRELLEACIRIADRLLAQKDGEEADDENQGRQSYDPNTGEIDE